DYHCQSADSTDNDVLF
nr:immunoglobulin light chain junction region [Macaca mulatta]